MLSEDFDWYPIHVISWCIQTILGFVGVFYIANNPQVLGNPPIPTSILIGLMFVVMAAYALSDILGWTLKNYKKKLDNALDGIRDERA